MKVAWNKDKTACAILSKFESFTIIQNRFDNNFSVKGWYNQEFAFTFGDNFKRIEDARDFLEYEIHKALNDEQIQVKIIR